MSRSVTDRFRSLRQSGADLMAGDATLSTFSWCPANTRVIYAMGMLERMPMASG